MSLIKVHWANTEDVLDQGRLFWTEFTWETVGKHEHCLQALKQTASINQGTFEPRDTVAYHAM